MNPRQRRLTADAERLRTEFSGHQLVSVQPIGFDPPEQYRVVFRLPGVTLDPASAQPVVTHEHRVLITLPARYPRDKPYCIAETPVFHPNFGAAAGDEICIGDYWTPSQTLVDIIAKIGDMLQFKTYNVKSPLNAVAAQWVAQNEQVFPLGDASLFQAEPEINLGPAAEAAGSTTIPTDSDDDGEPATAPKVRKVVHRRVVRRVPSTTDADDGFGSLAAQGPGWWQASDDRWYPPELHPDHDGASDARAARAPRRRDVLEDS